MAEEDDQQGDVWPDRLRAAQEVTAFEIGGRVYPRIPFGDEVDDWGGEGCGDCGVVRGQFHIEGCDIERCPKCAGQLISCDCADSELPEGKFDFQAHKDRAVNDYLLRKPHYDQLCLVAKHIIKEAIERTGIKVSSIDARAKEPDSFARKVAKPSDGNR